MITLNKYRIGYAAIPKVATTSIKEVLYEIEHGAPPPRDKQGSRIDAAHGAFKSVPFAKPTWLRRKWGFHFTVLRDPAARVLSCYSDKVLQVRNLEKINRIRRAALLEKGIDPRTETGVFPHYDFELDPMPTLSSFVLSLGVYRNLYGPIRDHTQPVQYHTGPDLGLYTRIYRVNEISDLQQDLREYTKKPELTIPMSNQSGDRFKMSVSDLSKEAYEFLMWWLEPEYEFLKDFFAPPPHKS